MVPALPQPVLVPPPAPPAVAVPVTPQVQPTPVAVLAANVARTQAMRAEPLKVGRPNGVTDDLYEGPREAQQVGALEWELGRKGSKEMIFKEAQAYAASRSAEGWRLPTLWELEALYQQKSVFGADLETAGYFWSDTAVVSGGDYHWIIDFDGGLVRYHHNCCRVRLVRVWTGK